MIKGFSLTELIILLLILGILAIVALPRMISLSDFRQDAVINKVKADLRYVREFAVNNTCRTRVAFETTGNTSYTATTDLSGVWDNMTDPATNASPFTVTLNTGSYAGIVITSVSFDGQSTIEFDSIGRPYAFDGVSAAALLTSNGSITFTGEASITVTIDTGRIS